MPIAPDPTKPSGNQLNPADYEQKQEMREISDMDNEHPLNQALRNDMKAPARQKFAAGWKKVRALMSGHKWNLNGEVVTIEEGKEYTVPTRTAKEMELVGHAEVTDHEADKPKDPQKVIKDYMPDSPQGDGQKVPTVKVNTNGDDDTPQTTNHIAIKDIVATMTPDPETFLSRKKPAEIVAWASQNLGMSIEPTVKKKDMISQITDFINAQDPDANLDADDAESDDENDTPADGEGDVDENAANSDQSQA